MEPFSLKYVNLCDCVAKLHFGGEGGLVRMFPRRYPGLEPIMVRTTVVTGGDEQYRQYHLLNRPAPVAGVVYLTETKDVHLCMTDKKDDIVSLFGFRKKENIIDVSLDSLTRHLHELERFPELSGNEAEFLWAVRDRAYERALSLLKDGVNVNVWHSGGITALYTLCSSGDIRGSEKLLAALLDAGADPNIGDYNGSTSFFMACQVGRFDMVKRLLEHGADINAKGVRGDAPLHIACSSMWHLAIPDELDKIARFLIEEHGAKVNARGRDGQTPLHAACWRDRTEITRFLIKHGANVMALDNEDNTPLHVACFRGHTELVRLLLSHGADPNAKDKDGETPLHWACRNGYPDIARVLLENGAEVNARNKWCYTPLDWACIYSHPEGAQLLLERGADVNVQDKRGTTPLHLACHGGSVDIIRRLLAAGADVDARTTNKWAQTPLHWASWRCFGAIKLLLEAGADPNAQTALGNTPLHIACHKDKVDCVDILLEHGADPGVRNEAGQVSLQLASDENKDKIAKLFEKHQKGERSDEVNNFSRTGN